MKSLFYIIVSLVLMGCQATANSHKTNTANTDRLFYNANNLACTIKFNDNPDYCQCFVKTISDISPTPLKQRIISGDSTASSDLAGLMIANSDKLRKCDALKIIDLAIPNIELPDLAKSVLQQHQGKVLTPENQSSLRPDLVVGYEFSMEIVGATDKQKYSQLLTKIDGNEFIFSLLDNGVVTREDLYLYRYTDNGVKHLVNQNSAFNTHLRNYQIPYTNKCLFVLGECQYSINNQSPKTPETIMTEFREGYWISNEPSFRGKRKIVIRIFGDDGLPLYEHTLFRNNNLEYYRQQRN
jgi:hypothetical protein